jgi:hypothetical protein
MSEHTSDEMRIELPEGEALPEVDPQADRRAEIAEAYERRREAEIQAQWEQAGLPADEAPEPPRREPDEEGERTETVTHRDDPRYPSVPPNAPPVQLIPMPLPNGGITHVTPEQAAYLAQLGMATLSQPQRPPQAPQQAYQPQPVYQQPRLDSERAKAIAQRISFGTTDEQAEALVEYAQLVQPDKEGLKRELRAEQMLEQNLQIIGQEYPEIFNDPVLTQVAALQLHNLRGHPAATQMSELDQYRAACSHVRSRFNPAPQQSTATPARGESRGLAGDRLERKRSAPSLPRGTDSRMVMQDREPSVPTASEVIAQIRRSRGQAA